MSEFTKKWRVKHDEPLNYNERIINSACDIIEKQDEQIKELESAINYATDGIDTLSPYLSQRVAKDMLAIKQTLEAKPRI